LIVLPAIDLFEGKVVRLKKGDYNEITVYSHDPIAKAKEFAACGARYLHVVDLEGARNGETPNIHIIERIAAESGLNIEVGGGIRTRAAAERYFKSGVWRVVLGTAAVENRSLLRSLIDDYGDRVAVGVDFRDGFVAVRGWTALSRVTPAEFTREMAEIGVKTLICTDISKDGLLSGINTRLYKELLTVGTGIVASGGVSSLSDIEQLRDIGVDGVILGRAIYTGDIDLAAAIEMDN